VVVRPNTPIGTAGDGRCRSGLVVPCIDSDNAETPFLL
jgi:hypothetical protein